MAEKTKGQQNTPLNPTPSRDVKVDTVELPREIGIPAPRLELLLKSGRMSKDERMRHDVATALLAGRKSARYLYAGLLARHSWEPGKKISKTEFIAAYNAHVKQPKGKGGKS